MSEYQSRYSNRPHTPSKSSGGFSSAFLFGMTGGAYRAPEPHRGGPERAFEEAYPGYDFSELVRLSLLLAGWLGRLRRRRGRRAQGLEPADAAEPTRPPPRWHGSLPAAGS